MSYIANHIPFSYNHKSPQQLISEKKATESSELDNCITKIKKILEVKEEENPLFFSILNNSSFPKPGRKNSFEHKTPVRSIVSTIVSDMLSLKKNQSKKFKVEVFSKFKSKVEIYVERLNDLKVLNSKVVSRLPGFSFQDLIKEIINENGLNSSLNSIYKISRVVEIASNLESSLIKLENYSKDSFQFKNQQNFHKNSSVQPFDSKNIVSDGFKDSNLHLVPFKQTLPNEEPKFSEKKPTSTKPVDETSSEKVESYLFKDIQMYIKKIEDLVCFQNKGTSFFVSILERSYFLKKTESNEEPVFEYKPPMISIVLNISSILNSLKENSSEDFKLDLISKLERELKVFSERLKYFSDNLLEFDREVLSKAKSSKSDIDQKKEEVKKREEVLTKIRSGENLEEFLSEDVSDFLQEINLEYYSLEKKIEQEESILRDNLMPFHFFFSRFSSSKNTKKSLQNDAQTLLSLNYQIINTARKNLELENSQLIEDLKKDKSLIDTCLEGLSRLMFESQKNISAFNSAIKKVSKDEISTNGDSDLIIYDYASNLFFSLEFLQSLQGEYVERFEC